MMWMCVVGAEMYLVAGHVAINLRAQDTMPLSARQTPATTLVFASAQHRRDSLDELVRRFFGRTDPEAARILAGIAERYVEHDSKTALGIARRVEYILAKQAPTPLRVRSLATLAYVCRTDGHYVEAKRNYEQALTMARTLSANGTNTDAEMVLVLSGLGFLEGEQGKLDRELARYIEALPFAERVAGQTGERYGLILVFMRLAGVYHSTKNYSRSDSLYTEALRYCRQGSDDDIRATIHNNRGILYEELKQSERALRAFHDGLVLAIHLGQTRSIGRFYNNISEVFTTEQMFDSALFYQTQALRLYKETNYQAGLANLLGTIAETQNKAGRYDAAIASARQALKYCEQNNFQPEKYAAYLTLSDAFAGLGNYSASLNAYKQAAALKDSMYSSATAEKLAELETAQKEQEIRLLQSEQQQSRITRNSLLAGALALLAIAVVLVVSNRRRKRDNRQLQDLNEQLFDANEELSRITTEKDEVMNIVTHGLKSQLFGVRTIATMLYNEATKHTSPRIDIAEASAKVRVAAEQMSELVANLLTMNEAEQGLLHPMAVRLNIAEELDIICCPFYDLAATKRITLHRESTFDADTDVEIYADRQMFREVITNLLSNAVKYSPHGKNVYLRLKSEEGNMKQEGAVTSSLISLSVPFNPSSFLRVEVQDEGPGILEEDMKKLFGKFARLSARPTGGEQSTGLGLNIVKKMVEAMNGKVWCESKAGNDLPTGATFIVVLPKA